MNTSKNNDEQLELRAYLLGMCPEPAEQEEIEEKLMLNNDYFQELLLQEGELIEDYVYDELSADERKYFEKHFLISDERQKKVKLERLLKIQFDNEQLRKTEKSWLQKKIEDLRRSFLSPIPVGVAILLVIITSVFLWNFYRESSDDQQKALLSLNKAYNTERPFDSRISEFDYAPYPKFRNNEEPKIDWIDQNLAERIALDEVSKEPTAESQHLLARVFLAKKEFKKALELLEKPRDTSPQKPEVLNDIGTAYLEQSKLASKDDEKLILIADAIENFDKALAIDPNLLSAKFNKAVALEIYLPNRAKEAWQEYLKLDQTSDWAKEAKERLENLNKQEAQTISSAEDLESAFLTAFNNGNDEKALQIVSQNRELINEKYLPQRFAMTIAGKKKTKEIEN